MSLPMTTVAEAGFGMWRTVRLLETKHTSRAIDQSALQSLLGVGHEDSLGWIELTAGIPVRVFDKSPVGDKNRLYPNSDCAAGARDFQHPVDLQLATPCAS